MVFEAAQRKEGRKDFHQIIDLARNFVAYLYLYLFIYLSPRFDEVRERECVPQRGKWKTTVQPFKADCIKGKLKSDAGSGALVRGKISFICFIVRTRVRKVLSVLDTFRVGPILRDLAQM